MMMAWALIVLLRAGPFMCVTMMQMRPVMNKILVLHMVRQFWTTQPSIMLKPLIEWCRVDKDNESEQDSEIKSKRVSTHQAHPKRAISLPHMIQMAMLLATLAATSPTPASRSWCNSLNQRHRPRQAMAIPCTPPSSTITCSVLQNWCRIIQEQTLSVWPLEVIVATYRMCFWGLLHPQWTHH
jgi:hypothetical protein